MGEPNLYERNDAIDADLDPTHGLTGAPVSWTDRIIGHAAKIRRIRTCWRKGSAKYKPIPGAVIDVPILDKKDGGATDTELRHTDIAKWGAQMASRAWAFGVDHAEKNGPVIDAQLICEGFDEKTGLFHVLLKGAIAVKCPNKEAGSREETEGDPRDRVINQLLEAIDRRDLRVERLADKIVGIAGGIEKVCEVAFRVSEKSIQLSNSVSDSAREDKRADQEFSLRVIQAHTIGETIKATVAEAAPHLKDIFAGFGAQQIRSYASMAKELLKSFTDDQRGKMAEAGLAELLADFEKILAKLSTTEDEKECRALMAAIAPGLATHQDLMGGLCTDKQRALVVGLLKRAGFMK